MYSKLSVRRVPYLDQMHDTAEHVPYVVFVGDEGWKVRVPLLTAVAASPLLATALEGHCSCTEDVAVVVPGVSTENIEMFVDFIMGEPIYSNYIDMLLLEDLCSLFEMNIQLDVVIADKTESTDLTSAQHLSVTSESAAKIAEPQEDVLIDDSNEEVDVTVGHNHHRNGNLRGRVLCKICQKWFSQRHQWKEHKCIPLFSKNGNESLEEMSSSNREINVSGKCCCQYCGKSFKRKMWWIAHESRCKHDEYLHVGNKKYKYCKQGYKTKQAGSNHEHVHSTDKEKPYKCRCCDKRFRHKSNVITHENIHTGEKPYKCKHCDKCFRLSADRRRHEYIHTGEKPIKCKYCNRYFRHKGDCTRHELTHTGEKPFSCKYCNRSFRLKCDWKSHEFIHTGDKPFKCKYCHMKFMRKTSRRRHELTHTGRKSFKCQYCNEYFRWKALCSNHERTHTGEQPCKRTLKFKKKRTCQKHEC